MIRRARKPGIFCAAAAAVYLGLGPGPLFSAAQPARLDDLFRIRNIEEAQISPAGDRVAYVLSEIDLAKNATRSGIWLVKTAGGPP